MKKFNFRKDTCLGSDCLYLLWKLLSWKIVNFLLVILTNDKQKIDYFPKKEALDDCYFQNSSF